MTKKKLYELGAEAKRELGEHTDKVVLQKVSRNQGITLYDLAKEFGWTRGRVLGSIQRLSKDGLVKTKTVLRHGKVVRIIYTAEYEEQKPRILEVPYELIAPENWKGVANAHVYALNRLSFLIEPITLSSINIDRRKLFVVKADLEHIDKFMRIKLPDEITDFYLLDNSGIAISSLGNEGDNVLVTIEATEVPIMH